MASNSSGTYASDGLLEDITDTVRARGDFKLLLTAMDIDPTVTAFTYSNFAYTTLLPLLSVYANYEGKNNYMLNSSFSGTDTVLGAITPSDAYKLVNQQGRRAALAFAREMTRLEGVLRTRFTTRINTRARRTSLSAVKRPRAPRRNGSRCFWKTPIGNRRRAAQSRRWASADRRTVGASAISSLCVCPSLRTRTAAR